MAGTKDGGIRAAMTNKEKHGDDFYREIGRIGGTKGRTGGFGQPGVGRERAMVYGAIGGAVSRRGYKLTDTERREVRARMLDSYSDALARLQAVHDKANGKA